MQTFRYADSFKVSELAEMAREFPNGGRLCFHPFDFNEVQIMLIHSPANATYPIHRHLDVDEFYIILQGTMILRTYGDGDEPANTSIETSLGNEEQQISAFQRVPKSVWHTVISGPGESLFFLEVKGGNWQPKMTRFHNS